MQHMHRSSTIKHIPIPEMSITGFNSYNSILIVANKVIHCNDYNSQTKFSVPLMLTN